MDAALQSLAEFIARHAAWAGLVLGVVTMLESLVLIGAFIPATALMVMAGGLIAAGVLDPVQVEAYGSLLPLNQVASLSIPEPALIVATPFDPSLAGAIERAIQKGNLGLNPASDGKAIRIRVMEVEQPAAEA